MDRTENPTQSCLSRRNFLKTSGGGIATMMLASIPGVGSSIPAWLKSFDRIRVAALADVRPHTPIHFRYPDAASTCFLVDLEAEAGGGVGPGNSIVAFHALCPHMGGSLLDTYKSNHRAAGPCPMHLSTFDLRKHGMVIAGHSTESLPQVVLEVDDGTLYATGMMGLIYGRHVNETR